jgi:type IV secretory pathway TraG/TraD family ATPase VirD4
METQLYYRPTDLNTAEYLEKRLGKVSAFAQSTTMREGQEIGEGLSESAIPLLTAQHILQMENDEVIAFHRHLPPFKLQRMDWQNYPQLRKRAKIPPPELAPLPELADIPPIEPAENFHYRYIDPDRPPRGEAQSQTVFLFDRSNSGGQDAGEKI